MASLFDLPDEEDEEWNEVPQALFLSWPRAMQLSYCAARDYNSALDAEGDFLEFYLERREAYLAEMRTL